MLEFEMTWREGGVLLITPSSAFLLLLMLLWANIWVLLDIEETQSIALTLTITLVQLRDVHRNPENGNDDDEGWLCRKFVGRGKLSKCIWAKNKPVSPSGGTDERHNTKMLKIMSSLIHHHSQYYNKISKRAHDKSFFWACKLTHVAFVVLLWKTLQIHDFTILWWAENTAGLSTCVACQI